MNKHKQPNLISWEPFILLCKLYKDTILGLLANGENYKTTSIDQNWENVIPFNVYVITEKAYSHLNAVGG